MTEASLHALAVPVVDTGPPPRLLGTAFPVKLGESTWFMTARHVAQAAGQKHVLQFAGPEDRPIFEDLSLQLRPVETVIEAEQRDVAILGVRGTWPSARIVKFGTSGMISARLLNVEFSQSLLDAQRKQFRIEPSHHSGYIVRHMVIPERATGAPMHAMLLSWAAMKGASGSPVLELADDGTVASLVGMVIENQESELLPAHIESVYSDGEIAEKHTYFLPNAVAIGWQHLNEFLAKAEHDGVLMIP